MDYYITKMSSEHKTIKLIGCDDDGEALAWVVNNLGCEWNFIQNKKQCEVWFSSFSIVEIEFQYQENQQLFILFMGSRGIKEAIVYKRDRKRPVVFAEIGMKKDLFIYANKGRDIEKII